MKGKRGKKYGKRNYKGGGSANRKASYAVKLAKRALRDAEGEHKIIDNNYGSGLHSISDSGTVYNLCLIGEGVDYNQRIGRKIKTKSLYPQLIFKQDSLATETVIRVIIFRDKANTGSPPTPLDVLQNGSYFDPLSYDNGGSRFRILLDKRYVFSNSGNKIAYLHKFKKLKNKQVNYLGPTANPSDCGTGTLFLLVISNEGVNFPTMEGMIRLRFVDA